MKYFLEFIIQTLRFVLKPLSFVPAIFMMCLIFSFSSQTGSQSGELSYKAGCEIIEIANEDLELGLSNTQVTHYSKVYRYYIRKAAHMTEYFLLAMAVAIPLYVYGVRGISLVLIAGAFCISYAGLDEFHQSFVGGRTPLKKDVLIDSIGVMIGITTVRILGFIGRTTIFRPLADNRKRRYG